MKNKFLLFLVPLLLYGCGNEQIQTCKAPKEASSSPSMKQPERPVSSPSMQQPERPVSAPPASRGFEAEVPAGWTEKPGSGMRIISYAIEGTTIDFYLISLSMGDVASNVNRWRGQVGLASAAPEEIAAEVQTFQAGGHDVHYIEIYNEEGGKGIIAAIVDLSPQFWYFTAKGTVNELKANASDIHRFLESLKINH